MNSNKNITTFKDEENKDELLKRKELEIEKNPIKQEAIRNYYGIALALMSALFLSLSVIFFKKAKFFSGSDQATVRYAIQLIIMVSVARYRQLKLFGAKEQRKLLIIRGIFGMCGLIFLHFSIKLIDPSDSASLLHTNVIIISILARLFLGEKLTVAHIISIIATVAGKL
jgi:drug/metabolite transporter (DMT)-like permease